MFAWLEKSNNRRILLQETPFVKKKHADISDSEWNGWAVHIFFSHFSRGVSFFFNKKINVDILNIHRSKDGGKLLVNAKIDNLFSIINIFATNKGQFLIQWIRLSICILNKTVKL